MPPSLAAFMADLTHHWEQQQGSEAFLRDGGATASTSAPIQLPRYTYNPLAAQAIAQQQQQMQQMLFAQRYLQECLLPPVRLPPGCSTCMGSLQADLPQHLQLQPLLPSPPVPQPLGVAWPLLPLHLPNQHQLPEPLLLSPPLPPLLGAA